MSYQVIARKYRPQTFDEVIGQPLIIGTLKNAILHNRVAHGYIFSGGRGVGKTTTARVLAKGLNCAQGPTVTPDGTCPSCLEIAAGNSVDVLEIDAASNRGIDEIRELRETVRYLPARDRYKVFIIDEVHMLTSEAFNALLKTLEEPPPRALFILATTEPHKLPSTIQSRCQHFAFRLLDYAEIEAQLKRIVAAEGIQSDAKALGSIAQAAEGSMRDALSILDQVIAACGDRLDEVRVRQLLGVVPLDFMNQLAEAIHAADAKRVLESVGELESEGYELGHFCGEFTRYVRNLMVAKSCGERSALLQVSGDEREALGKIARLFSEEDLSRFFQIMLRTEGDLRYSLQPRFHLELGLMKLVHSRRLKSLETVLGELGASSSSVPRVSEPRPSTAGVPGEAPRPGRTGLAPAGVRPAGDRPASDRLVGEKSAAADATRSPYAPPAGPKRQDAAGAIEPEPAPEPPVGRESPPITAGPASYAANRAPSTAATDPAPRLAVAPPAEDARLAAIKTLVFGQSKMLGALLDPLIGWRFENGEVSFAYAKRDSGIADLLRSRERQEALQAACARVLGEAVKVCVTLVDGEEEGADVAPSARERAASDPVVEAFRRRFDCAWVDVQDLSRG